MDDNEKEFENFIREIKFDDTPDSSHRDKLEQDLLLVLSKQAKRQKCEIQKNWVPIVKRHIIKPASAAQLTGQQVSVNLTKILTPSKQMHERRLTMNPIELLRNVMNGKITRREFIVTGSICLSAYIFGKPIVEEAQATVGRAIHKKAKSFKENPEYKIALIRKVFGDFRKSDYKFTPGTAHPHWLKKMHPDDVRAAVTLEKVGLQGIEKLIEVKEDYIDPEDLNGNVIALGSPMSNFVSRSVLEYRYITDNPFDGLIRMPGKVFFNLPFEYCFDSEYLMKEFLVTKRFVGGNKHNVPNWCIVDKEKEDLLVPQTDSEGNLKTDFLLVTVLPNTISRDAYERGDRIIILGGTHGIGTKAIDILFQNEQILSALATKAKRTPYWQALIQVNRITHLSRDKESEAFSIGDKIQCEPVVCRNSEIHKYIKV